MDRDESGAAGLEALRVRLALWVVAVGALLGACEPGPGGRIPLVLEATPEVIGGAVSGAEAIERLTEATLRCVQAVDVVGLEQWICEVDNSAGSDSARYFVTVLADTEDRLRFIDAQVMAVGDARAAEGFASFFRDTVVGRLLPDPAGNQQAGRWLEGHVDGTGSGDLGSVHMRLDRLGRTVRLQLSQAADGG